MKKTFRKALACLLAVLMVVFSVPFSALAYSTTVGEPNYKWWDDSALPTEVPEYTHFNTKNTFGKMIAANAVKGAAAANKRWNMRPVIGVTVSSMGNADSTFEEMDAYNEGYYGKVGYDDAAAAGVILNPTDLKAGQRIAVTMEFGGIDLMNNGQIMSAYDSSKIVPGGYWDFAVDNEMDTWENDSSYATYAIVNSSFTPVLNIVDTDLKLGMAVNSSFSEANKLLPNSMENWTGIQAKYGVPCGTFFFEVQEDCDLTEVITFNTGRAGCVFQWCADGLLPDVYNEMTLSEEEHTFALIAPPIWTNASSAPQPEVHEHDYQEVSRTAATCENDGVINYECKSTTGTCDAPTKTETITKLNHDYKSEITTPASCTEEGVMTWTCQNPEATCERHSYTTPIAKTDHNYQNKEVDRKDATCTAAGYVITADVCTVCGAEKADTRVNTPIAEKGHDWGEWITDVPANETTEGKKHRVCKNDSTHTEEDIIPIVECKHAGTTHEVDVEVIKAATCKDEGTKKVNVICDVCKNVIETKEVAIPVDATNHVGTTHTEDVITKAATCQETGLKNVVTICDDCGEPVSTVTDVVIPITKQHTPGEPVVTRVEATLDAPGSITTVVKCIVCGAEISKDVQPIAQLKGYTVTVDAADMGKVTLNGTDVSEGAAIKVLAGSQITLTAEPTDGATFVGWTANGKTLVSTDAEFTTTALANVTYTPVFDVVEEAAFTVTFVDAFGNIVAIVDSAALNADAIPTAPARAGYAYATDNGWSMTNEEILGRTENTTVSAQYVKAEEVLYTVNAAGCEITANGETDNDTVSVPYDTKVTVTNTTATAWIVKDAKTGEEIKVGYGDSYTFFVTADITLTFDTESVDATPQVVNIGKSSVGTAPRIQAAFKATRTMTDDCQYIASGFVYGKGDLGEITLDNVDGKAIKAIYSKTDSEQFTLTYGLSAQQGTITAVAFLAYVDANGQNQVKYAAPMTYTYGE